jgi:hypothetical protein
MMDIVVPDSGNYTVRFVTLRPGIRKLQKAGFFLRGVP